MKMHELMSSTNAFAARLEDVLDRLGMLDVCKEFEMDHICVRLNSDHDVTALSLELGEIAQKISAVNVNGRVIQIFQLHEPLQVGMWQTRGLELPFPKYGRFYSEGWEHVEFVVPGLINTMKDLKSFFAASFPHLLDSKHVESYQLKLDEPQAEGDQDPNPTLAVTSSGAGIKFHALPIQQVVGYQKPAH